MGNNKGAVIVVLRRSYENITFAEALDPLFDDADQAYEYLEQYMADEAAEYAEIYGEDNVRISDNYEIIIRRGTDTHWIVSEFTVSEVF